MTILPAVQCHVDLDLSSFSCFNPENLGSCEGRPAVYITGKAVKRQKPDAGVYIEFLSSQVKIGTSTDSRGVTGRRDRVGHDFPQVRIDLLLSTRLIFLSLRNFVITGSCDDNWEAVISEG